MDLLDQHIHTAYSFDSKAELEAYVQSAVERGRTVFTSTEHLDYSSCMVGYDIVPDFSAKAKEIARLEEQYPIRILQGVEVSYKSSVVEQIQEMLAKQHFDVVVLGIHDDGDWSDVSMNPFLEVYAGDAAYRRYLELTYEAVTKYDDYDILAHMDYILRHLEGVSMEEHIPMLHQIFRVLIAKNKVLELNTRLIYQHKVTTYIEIILKEYVACGGKRISLGSDAHTIANFENGFDVAIELLQAYGIDHIVAFCNRKEYKILLSDNIKC